MATSTINVVVICTTVIVCYILGLLNKAGK